MIVSRSSNGLERRPDGLWWNPDIVAVDAALLEGAPEGGMVGVPGGRAIFDLFLRHGFDAFDLARAERVALPGGDPVFSECADGTAAADVLRRHGLGRQAREVLDPAAGVSLEVWRRQP
jgi:hypothetical protein